jgi:hypothetical protein
VDTAMVEAARCVLLLGRPSHTTLAGSVRWTDALGNLEGESGLPSAALLA